MTQLEQMPRFDVNRYGQRFSEDEWPLGLELRGFGREYWGDRACGVACLKMILEYYDKEKVPLVDLLRNGLLAGAYSDRGWIHHGLANLGRQYGLPGLATKVDTSADIEAILLTTGPFIASVTLHFPEDGRKGGHLVVVCGLNTQDGTRIIEIRDPSTWGQRNISINEERFMSSFSGRGICFHPSALILSESKKPS